MLVCRSCNKEVSELPDGSLCEECIIYIQQFEEDDRPCDMIVTREMALDAGIPELEGTTVRW